MPRVPHSFLYVAAVYQALEAILGSLAAKALKADPELPFELMLSTVIRLGRVIVSHLSLQMHAGRYSGCGGLVAHTDTAGEALICLWPFWPQAALSSGRKYQTARTGTCGDDAGVHTNMRV